MSADAHPEIATTASMRAAMRALNAMARPLAWLPIHPMLSHGTRDSKSAPGELYVSRIQLHVLRVRAGHRPGPWARRQESLH